jgi:hypothetical protein
MFFPIPKLKTKNAGLCFVSGAEGAGAALPATGAAEEVQPHRPCLGERQIAGGITALGMMGAWDVHALAQVLVGVVELVVQETMELLMAGEMGALAFQ